MNRKFILILLLPALSFLLLSCNETRGIDASKLEAQTQGEIIKRSGTTFTGGTPEQEQFALADAENTSISPSPSTSAAKTDLAPLAEELTSWGMKDGTSAEAVRGRSSSKMVTSNLLLGFKFSSCNTCIAMEFSITNFIPWSIPRRQPCHCI